MPTLLRRIRALVLAHLAAWRAADPPLTVLAVHALISAVLCGLTRGFLEPLGYALFAFTVSGALLVLPFLGELGFLLRDDPASEWSRALPATGREQRAARALAVVVILWALALGSLVPAALLAPEGFTTLGQLALVPAGLGAALALGGILLAVQQVLARRPALLSLAHTALFAGLLLLAVVGLPKVRLLAGVAELSDLGAPLVWLAPPVWFAAPFAAGGPFWAPFVPVGAVLLGAALLALLPLPKAAPLRGRDALGTLLEPLRRLAVRTWVRREERATFELVFDALPHERETNLRTRPLVALPLLFLLAAFDREPGPERDGLLALLLFAAGIYLPVLAAHVPASASHRARWILDGAPLAVGALQGGAFKALVLRALVPLYLVLFLFAGALADWSFAARIAPLAALFALATLRRSWFASAKDLPLSLPPERAAEGLNLSGPLFGAAMLATLSAVLAAKLLTTWPLALAALAPLLAHELLLDRAWRRPPAAAPKASP